MCLLTAGCRVRNRHIRGEQLQQGENKLVVLFQDLIWPEYLDATMLIKLCASSLGSTFVKSPLISGTYGPPSGPAMPIDITTPQTNIRIQCVHDLLKPEKRHRIPNHVCNTSFNNPLSQLLSCVDIDRVTIQSRALSSEFRIV